MIIIPVGIPGCGKSTWACAQGYSPVRLHSFLGLTSTLWDDGVSRIIVSSDQIREHMGNINDQSQNKSVFDLFYGFTNYHLGYYAHSVYADATNLERRSREELYKIAKRYDAKVHVLLFNNPMEAIMRNRKRERVVPEDVMHRMIGKLERARVELLQEPYDSITTISSVR
jgi:predicted kinase